MTQFICNETDSYPITDLSITCYYHHDLSQAKLIPQHFVRVLITDPVVETISTETTQHLLTMSQHMSCTRTIIGGI